MAKRKKPATITEQLRETLGKAESLYDLAEESGVDRAVISRFMTGKRTITLETLDKLAEVLKLRLVR